MCFYRTPVNQHLQMLISDFLQTCTPGRRKEYHLLLLESRMDIEVSLYQTLPDGWKIFLCRRYFVNYDTATDSWIAPEARMGVTPCRVWKESLRKLCTSIGFEENCDTTTVPLNNNNNNTNNNNNNNSSDIVEICRISELPKSDPVAVNSPPPGQTHHRSSLQIGDILLDSHSSWQKGTLQQAIRAKTNAINAGLAFYVMYFAQPPTPLAKAVGTAVVRKNATTTMMTTTTTTTTTTTPQATTVNAACADTNNSEATLNNHMVSRVVVPHLPVSPPQPRTTTMTPQRVTVPQEAKNNNNNNATTKRNKNNNNIAATKRQTNRCLVVEPKANSTSQQQPRPRMTKNSWKTNGSAQQMDLESSPGQNSQQQQQQQQQPPIHHGLTKTDQHIDSMMTTTANNMMQNNINDTTTTTSNNNNNNNNNSCTQPLTVEPQGQIPLPLPTTAVVNVTTTPTQTSATAANHRTGKNSNNDSYNNSCIQTLTVEPKEQIPVPLNVPTTAVMMVTTPTQTNGNLISTPPDSSMPMPPEQLTPSETIHATNSPVEAEPVGVAIPDNVLSVDQQPSAYLEPTNTPPLASSTTTTKRRSKRKILNHEDKRKRSKVNHHHGDLFGKMKPKHINDQLTQQASVKHTQAVMLLDQCKELATKLVEYDTVAGENALKIFHDWTLPAIPTKITPPQETNDRAEMYQRVGEYHAELEKQNVHLEGLIGSMDQWCNQRLAEAVQNWQKQSEKHQQCQNARDEVHKRVQELEQELVKAKELFENAVVEEVDATREEKHCFEVTLDCFKSKI